MDAETEGRKLWKESRGGGGRETAHLLILTGPPELQIRSDYGHFKYL